MSRRPFASGSIGSVAQLLLTLVSFVLQILILAALCSTKTCHNLKKAIIYSDVKTALEDMVCIDLSVLVSEKNLELLRGSVMIERMCLLFVQALFAVSSFAADDKNEVDHARVRRDVTGKVSSKRENHATSICRHSATMTSSKRLECSLLQTLVFLMETQFSKIWLRTACFDPIIRRELGFHYLYCRCLWLGCSSSIIL